MITAVHALLYSRDASAARAFLRDALRWKNVDAGDGWLIFALPPAEIAVHPTHVDHGPDLYLMCDDIEATLTELRGKGVTSSRPVVDQGWGLVTTIRIPGGIDLGLYEPRHPLAARVAKRSALRATSATARKRKSRPAARKRRARR
jgi:predicted enzyme related to lactoylglutathione lyase